MRIALTASAIAIALVGLAGAPTPAQAAGYSFSIDGGNVAFGYRDGYWDRGHQWHTWSPADAHYYRTHYREHYYHVRHDRYREGGWRREWWNEHHR